MQGHKVCFTLRIDENIMKKLTYVVDFEGRSKNGAIARIIKRYIAEFEKENGDIDFKDTE